MSAFMEWHLGHVVRLIGGRGSGSIPKTMDGNAEVRLSRIAHGIALLDLAQEWKLRKIGAGSYEFSPGPLEGHGLAVITTVYRAVQAR